MSEGEGGGGRVERRREGETGMEGVEGEGWRERVRDGNEGGRNIFH